MTLKLLVFGSRSFTDYELLKKECDKLVGLHDVEDILIISGGAIGADNLSTTWSRERQYDHYIIRPKWDKHGKSAGFKRNVRMCERCTEAIGFWDGQSNGTKHTIRYMTKLKKPLTVINYITGEKSTYNMGTRYEVTY